MHGEEEGVYNGSNDGKCPIGDIIYDINGLETIISNFDSFHKDRFFIQSFLQDQWHTFKEEEEHDENRTKCHCNTDRQEYLK